MKLLFKDTAEGELKELLGFLDADFSFQNIKSDLITATRDVKAVIGDAVYNKALKIYDPEEDADDSEMSSDDCDFLYLVRYPIAVQAYRLYAPSNDLSHTNDGRRMRLDDHEKQAFEWLLDRDNEALERRFYRAIDDLIQYLEEKKIEEWLSSENYKTQKSLFVPNTKDFDMVFPINSRLLFLKLVPGLKQCQEYEIRPRLGEKYDIVLTKLKDNSELSLDEMKMLVVIRQAMVYFSLAWAMPRLSVNLFPEGVLQSYRSERATTNSRKPALKLETQEAQQAFRSDFEKSIFELERILTPPVVPDANCKTVDPKIIKGDNFISL